MGAPPFLISLELTSRSEYEDIKTLSDLLDMKNKAEGLDVWIHVDAASGGFVAPFVNPGLLWDFRVRWWALHIEPLD